VAFPAERDELEQELLGDVLVGQMVGIRRRPPGGDMHKVLAPWFSQAAIYELLEGLLSFDLKLVIGPDDRSW